ncbi:MAG: hypothetical protein QW279_05455 [Candidatus Jordarchaeaceae archaeon]
MFSGNESYNSRRGKDFFEELILQTVETVLRNVLGESSANIIIIYAKKSDPARWEEDPEKVKLFLDVLRSLIGLSSQIIEHLILKTLYSKLDLNFEEKQNYDFWDYIKELLKRCIGNNT